MGHPPRSPVLPLPWCAWAVHPRSLPLSSTTGSPGTPPPPVATDRRSVHSCTDRCDVRSCHAAAAAAPTAATTPYLPAPPDPSGDGLNSSAHVSTTEADGATSAALTCAPRQPPSALPDPVGGGPRRASAATAPPQNVPPSPHTTSNRRSSSSVWDARCRQAHL
ncbi:hypothetical protein BU14_0319s0027 [Porphyra umbilicalis]|uniref:Uncharacterized protein n=1 Tax=Porphyra umbilicalis TaxID=2786 RepID=A0A1X6NZA2_PORUM|nr:hypothetical protein BU14_0319s0027 [Porphyra umbilicalis]|eukprot:OSX73939.1 hypothetical protein BU14_0319s0027 [Porphyra umbilicalis]